MTAWREDARWVLERVWREVVHACEEHERLVRGCRLGTPRCRALPCGMWTLAWRGSEWRLERRGWVTESPSGALTRAVEACITPALALQEIARAEHAAAYIRARIAGHRRAWNHMVAQQSRACRAIAARAESLRLAEVV